MKPKRHSVRSLPTKYKQEKVNVAKEGSDVSALLLAIGILSLIFCFMLFKNISYPLLFNDEAETAMNAQQVLKYGYPKGHDEKNTVFIPDNPQWLGYKKSDDANISIPWGNYYFGAIGVYMASFSDDIYTKTALVRIPFALAGFAGICLLIISFRMLFETRKNYYWFVVGFIVLELLSVNLFLHLREARYYALVVLAVSLYLFLFIRRFLVGELKGWKYIPLMSIVLFLGYNVNFITYIVMNTSLGLYLLYELIDKVYWRKIESWGQSFWNLIFYSLPMLLSGLAVLPLLIYFETFETAQKASEYYKFTSEVFWKHLDDILMVLNKHEMLYAILFLKIIMLGFYYYSKGNGPGMNVTQGRLIRLSLFFLLFIVLYCLMTARMPFIWMRYFVVLQPLLMLMALMDGYLILTFIANKNTKVSRFQFVLAVLLVYGFIAFNKKESFLKDYYYQLTHRYKGPLDEYIPFIKEKFPITDSLVIGTNYEELSYMYYLNSKVILGYNYGFRNLTEDSLKLFNPDILIFRKKWGQNPGAYNYYIQNGKFERTSFNTVDWPVNNLADLEFFVKHQFKTLETKDEKEKADIFIRVKE